tara:strand:+ start:627 stop:878 length:252 start_codon:yes stop_codon:yes gene_type:complete
MKKSIKVEMEWGGILEMLLAIYEDAASQDSKDYAKEELKRMASLAVEYNLMLMAEEEHQARGFAKSELKKLANAADCYIKLKR